MNPLSPANSVSCAPPVIGNATAPVCGLFNSADPTSAATPRTVPPTPVRVLRVPAPVRSMYCSMRVTSPMSTFTVNTASSCPSGATGEPGAVRPTLSTSTPSKGSDVAPSAGSRFGVCRTATSVAALTLPTASVAVKRSTSSTDAAMLSANEPLPATTAVAVALFSVLTTLIVAAGSAAFADATTSEMPLIGGSASISEPFGGAGGVRSARMVTDLLPVSPCTPSCPYAVAVSVVTAGASGVPASGTVAVKVVPLVVVPVTGAKPTSNVM